MKLEEYLEERVLHFKERISQISACRQKEMSKPYAKRNHNLLYAFHKDESAYHFCIKELETIKQKCHEQKCLY